MPGPFCFHPSLDVMTPAQKRQKVNFALQQFSAGRLEQAESLCREVLADDGDEAEAWFTLGWINRRRKQVAEAIDCFQKAVLVQRNDARFFNALGAALSAAGRFADAASSYRRALELQPAYAEAHGNLARALWLMGDSAGADEAYQASIRLAPALAEAQSNYGNFLRRTGKLTEAIAAHQKAISLKPSVPEFHLSLGLDQLAQHRIEDAAASFARALKLNPDYATACAYLGHASQLLKRWEFALACFDKVLQKHPDHPDTHLARAWTLEQLGRADEAIAGYTEALRLVPGWDAAEFNLAAIRGGRTVHEVPAETIQELFDNYADRFEDHLVGQLNYCAPQLLREALVPHLTGRGAPDTIDLGCGTGLVGAMLRPYAAALTGVDLAPKMIERARVRGIYDELEVGDVTETLRKRPDAFDLAVAGDVLIYLGNLAPVFQAARTALRPGGLFAFTLEAHDGEDYVVRPSRRFAHSERYILKLAADNGFVTVSWTTGALRTESGQPINGFIVILRTPG